MTARAPHRGNSEHRGTVFKVSPVSQITSEDLQRAKVWRRLNAAMTPEKKAQKAWRKSSGMRRKPITLPSKPFDHRSES